MDFEDPECNLHIGEEFDENGNRIWYSKIFSIPL